MGIYIVRAKNTNWYKIGHHKITDYAPFVYCRWFMSGFTGVIHPPNVAVWRSDIELICWFPTPTIQDELRIHGWMRRKPNSNSVTSGSMDGGDKPVSLYTANISEWYQDLAIDKFIEIHKAILGEQIQPTDEELARAYDWLERLQKQVKRGGKYYIKSKKNGK